MSAGAQIVRQRIDYRLSRDKSHEARMDLRRYLRLGGWSRVLYRKQCSHCTRSVGQGTVALIDIYGYVVMCERCLPWEEGLR